MSSSAVPGGTAAPTTVDDMLHEGRGASTNPCEGYSFTYVDFTQLPEVRSFFIVAYVLVMSSSLVGNLLVIFTVVRHKHMRNATNYYILNLAVADLLVCVFVMPLKLLEYTAPCQWSVLSLSALCPPLYFAQPVFVFTSILTLVAISLERYFAIVHPLSEMQIHRRNRTRKVVAIVWALPMVLAAPYLYCKSYPFSIRSHLGEINREICTDRFDDIDVALFDTPRTRTGSFRTGYFLFLFAAMYVVPLSIISATCFKIGMKLMRPVEHRLSRQRQRMLRRREANKRKVARMIMLVAVVFFLCWTPFYLVSLVSQLQHQSFLKRSNFIFTMLTTHLVGFLNSCLNPIIYAAMNRRFRHHFDQILRKLLCWCRWPRTDRSRKRIHWSFKHPPLNDYVSTPAKSASAQAVDAAAAAAADDDDDDGGDAGSCGGSPRLDHAVTAWTRHVTRHERYSAEILESRTEAEDKSSREICAVRGHTNCSNCCLPRSQKQHECEAADAERNTSNPVQSPGPVKRNTGTTSTCIAPLTKRSSGSSSRSRRSNDCTGARHSLSEV